VTTGPAFVLLFNHTLSLAERGIFINEPDLDAIVGDKDNLFAAFCQVSWATFYELFDPTKYVDSWIESWIELTLSRSAIGH
jgi:hypothetical protein